MDCPGCKHKSIILKKVFRRKKDSKNYFCINCDAEVKIHYKRLPILFMISIGIGFLLYYLLYELLNLSVSIRGLTTGVSAGIIIGLLFGAGFFTKVELISNKG